MKQPSALAMRALARAFTIVGHQRGIGEWVQVGANLNLAADERDQLGRPPANGLIGGGAGLSLAVDDFERQGQHE